MLHDKIFRFDVFVNKRLKLLRELLTFSTSSLFTQIQQRAQHWNQKSLCSLKIHHKITANCWVTPDFSIVLFWCQAKSNGKAFSIVVTNQLCITNFSNISIQCCKVNPSRTQSNVSVLSTNQKICFVLLSAKFLRPRTVYNSLASRKLGKVFHPQKNSSPSNCTKKKSLYLFTAVTPFVLSSLINLFGSKKVNVTFFLVFTHFLLKNLLKGNIDFAIRFHIAR